MEKRKLKILSIRGFLDVIFSILSIVNVNMVDFAMYALI